jgi:hypothetical protein
VILALHHSPCDDRKVHLAQSLVVPAILASIRQSLQIEDPEVAVIS